MRLLSDLDLGDMNVATLNHNLGRGSASREDAEWWVGRWNATAGHLLTASISTLTISHPKSENDWVFPQVDLKDTP